MKLLRLKITDPLGFRSLQPDFEYVFRSNWMLREEQGNNERFAPFVCAGPNGSGKSNLLEALAAIFYQLECRYLDYLPEVLQSQGDEENADDKQYQALLALRNPQAFELEYLIKTPDSYQLAGADAMAHIRVIKSQNSEAKIFWLNQSSFGEDKPLPRLQSKDVLPDYVLGYSSGENEVLSLPFFKMRFIQFDEYWQALTGQLPYPGRPETRMAYLDSSFSQAILLCNLLFQDFDTLEPFREDVGIEDLKQFRIIIRRSIDIDVNKLIEFGSKDESKRESIAGITKNHPAIITIDSEDERNRYRVNLMELLEVSADSENKLDTILARLKRCATCFYVDDETDSLYLDYCVDDATKEAFTKNFDDSPIQLFQAFQVLLALNLYTVGDALKADLYKSDSHYVSETVPTLASDERIMRFKFVKFTKTGVKEPVMLKSLSDGEHQLLHSLGLCLLFRNTNSLFLLDEPETHFNPDWRSNFITRLHECFRESEDTHEMLITTHTPFLISDSKPEKVLVFKKKDGKVTVKNPDYNTLGASINKITMNTFGKRETIGGHAQATLEKLRSRFDQGDDKEQLIAEINQQLGDSVEKVLLIKSILDSMEVC